MNIVIRLGSNGVFIVAINDGYYFITGNFNYLRRFFIFLNTDIYRHGCPPVDYMFES